jgi:maltoporin
VFVGAVSASIAIVEEYGANTDTLDFSALSLGDDTGVSVDLALTASQSVTATLTLTLSDATGIENVTGTEAADTMLGNTWTMTATKSESTQNGFRLTSNVIPTDGPVPANAALGGPGPIARRALPAHRLQSTCNERPSPGS